MMPSVTWLTYALPTAYALALWWLSTGVILALNNLPRRTHRWSMLGATVLLGLSLHLLRSSSTDPGIGGAYVAFTCALAVWGWQEMSFFMGFITGPLRAPCPPGCTGWPRFVRAVQACLYHELASLAAGAAVLATTAGGANHVGAWTYVVLWVMRMSAKFNVFLGVRNLGAEFIPEHLGFIRSYLRRRPMNALFPVAVALSTLAAVLLVQHAAALGSGPDANAAAATGATFIAVLMILAVLEHWFLVLPLSTAGLWNWSLRVRDLGVCGLTAVRRSGMLGRSRRPADGWGSFPASVARLVPGTLPPRDNRLVGGDR